MNVVIKMHNVQKLSLEQQYTYTEFGINQMKTNELKTELVIVHKLSQV